MGSFDPLSMVASGFNTLTGGSVNHYENNRQMHFQSDEADEARAFQQDMYNQQKQFQREEREAAQQYYTDEWKRQFQAQSAWQNEQYWSHVNSERAYNSPANQAQLLRSAGINPAVVGIGGASGTTFAAPTAVSASPQMPAAHTPSPPSGVMAGSVPPASIGSIADSFASFTAGLKNMSESAKTDEDRKRLSNTQDLFYQLMANQVLSSSIDNDMKKVELIISQATKGDKIKDAYYSWLTKLTQSQVDKSIYDYNVQKKLTEEFNTLAAGIEKDMKAEEYNQLLYNGSMLPALIARRLRVMDSEAFKNTSEGNLFGEQRSRISKLTPLEVQNMRTDIVNGKIKNITDAENFITKLFGEDSTVGKHFKQILRYTKPEEYANAVNGILTMFEKEQKREEKRERKNRKK